MPDPFENHLPELETSPKPQPRILQIFTLASLALAVLALFLFAWIAESVSLNKTVVFDAAVRARVHQYASPSLTRFMFGISYLGGNGLIIAACGAFFVFLYFRWRRATLWLVITILGALVLDVSLKSGFHRQRPAPFFGAMPLTYSFPSGHSLFSFCFYGVLAGLWAGRVRSTRLRILIWSLAALLVSLIGLSRIYLGVHYPSDVIAGYLAATIWVGTLVGLDRLRVQRRGRRKKQISVQH
jgi:undecaprenyl-diphosphatase